MKPWGDNLSASTVSTVSTNTCLVLSGLSWKLRSSAVPKQLKSGHEAHKGANTDQVRGSDEAKDEDPFVWQRRTRRFLQAAAGST